MIEQLTPFELERQGFTLKRIGEQTDFPEYASDGTPTWRVLQYYKRGDETYAITIQERW